MVHDSLGRLRHWLCPVQGAQFLEPDFIASEGVELIPLRLHAK